MKTFKRLTTVDRHTTSIDMIERHYLQSGAIWINGNRPESIQAQVMHYDKDKKLVFCIQKTNFGYNDIAPDTYTLDEFLEDFIFMGVKK